jgi:hypothetical protein
VALESKDRDSLEDIISSLNIIAEKTEGAIHASSPSETNDRQEPDKAARDDASIALEEYLASRLHQVGEVAPEKKEIGGLRTGNGWDANQVIENVFKIEPIPMKRAVEIALSSGKTFKERLWNIFRRPKEVAKIVGTPTVEFVPIWKVKGYHECYYLRTNAYKINVKDDVVGVEVEGKSRDLMLEKKRRHFITSAIVERFQMLGAFLTSESKYFVVTDVLELATKRSTSELTITGLGKTMDQEEEMAVTSWKSKRIFDLSELTVRGARVHVRECILTKEGVLSKFREQVVRMPERFKQILSNRLQILELKRIYIPLIRIPVQKGPVPREVVANGASGDLADSRLMELLE